MNSEDDKKSAVEYNGEVTKLFGLISMASPIIAVDLFKHLERIKSKHEKVLPVDELLNILRRKVRDYKGKIPRYPSLSRLFFQPFSQLFVNDINKSLPGSFPRSCLNPIWEIVKDTIGNDKIKDLELQVVDALDSNDNRAARNIALQLQKSFFSIINSDGEYKKNFSELATKVLGDDSPDYIVRFADWLYININNDDGILIDVDLASLNGNAMIRYANYFQKLDELDIKLASEFLLLLATSSSKPWLIFRLLKVVNPNIDEKRLDMTPYKIIAERMFARIDEYVTVFASVKDNKFHGSFLAMMVETYNKYTNGFEREGIFTINGPWRLRYNEIRTRASSILTNICHEALNAVERSLPMDRLMVKGKGRLDVPRTGAIIDKERYDRAYEYVKFLKETVVYAKLAGFSVSRDNAWRDITTHLDILSDAMVNENKEGKRGLFFYEWSDALIKITYLTYDDVIAESLKRKLAY